MKLLSALLFLAASPSAEAIKPKMLAEPSYTGKPLKTTEDADNTVRARSAVTLGECHWETPFSFELYGPSGHVAVGYNQEAGEVKVKCKGATVTANVEATTNDFFGSGSTDTGMVGYPLEYKDVGSEGVSCIASCQENTPLIIIAKDSVDLEIEAKVTETLDGDELEVQGGMKADGNLVGRPLTIGRGHARRPNPVSFDWDADNFIRIHHEKGNSENGIALIDGFFIKDGQKVKRTFIKETKAKKDTFQNPKNIPIKCCEINEDGDIELEVLGSLMNSYESLRFDIRVGIKTEGSSDARELVDISTILTSDENKAIIHSGWARNGLADEGADEEAWDIVVMDAVATDPQDGYAKVAEMKEPPKSNGISHIPGHQRRQLSAPPSVEEVEISEEMRMGRKPVREVLDGEGRRLQTGQKLLVHGYCASGNPFTTNHFSNYLTPSWPNESVSHDTFARKIRDYGSSLASCGIIAHSQGGAATLHLYTYYWSCLDYSTTGGRMIQSVGTPYQGTPLAGNVAVLGQIFGVGCGANTDLSTSGASAWLSGIPSWARSKVTYYTTSFTDVWWKYDYCQIASDVLLSDPDDGTTEYARGQLSYANDGGHKYGWCHTSGMRDPSQTTDYSRNIDMNSNAQY